MVWNLFRAFLVPVTGLDVYCSLVSDSSPWKIRSRSLIQMFRRLILRRYTLLLFQSHPSPFALPNHPTSPKLSELLSNLSAQGAITPTFAFRVIWQIYVTVAGSATYFLHWVLKVGFT